MNRKKVQILLSKVMVGVYVTSNISSSVVNAMTETIEESSSITDTNELDGDYEINIVENDEYNNDSNIENSNDVLNDSLDEEVSIEGDILVEKTTEDVVNEDIVEDTTKDTIKEITETIIEEITDDIAVGIDSCDGCTNGCNDCIVTFEDANLENKVRETINKTTGIVYKKDVINIKNLDARSSNIQSLKGIENLTSLEILNLGDNKIRDISHLSGLNNLKILFLNNNYITDIKPLENMSNMVNLYVHFNFIDVKPNSNAWVVANKLKATGATVAMAEGTNYQYLIKNNGQDIITMNVGDIYSPSFNMVYTQDSITALNAGYLINRKDLVYEFTNKSMLSVNSENKLETIASDSTKLTVSYLGIPFNGTVELDINVFGEVEDNWLNREVARQVGKNLEDLTDNDYLNIVEIFLNHSNISEPIPKEIGKLTNLEVLALYNNSIYGEIPREIGNLKKLQVLSLNHNKLSGSIPEEIFELSNLRRFHLGDNQLTGEIPDLFDKLTNLEEGVYLYDNKLSGSIPKTLGSLDKVREIWIYNNNLTGTIPVELTNLNNIYGLRIDNNNLSGSIPNGFSNLTNLELLTLHNNNLSGKLPDDILKAPNLIVLNVSNNKLSGKIPTEFSDLLSYDYGDRYPPSWGWHPTSFSNNQFIGDISNELINKIGAEAFHGNMLSNGENQKQLVLKTPETINTTLGDRIILSDLKSKVELDWNGVREPLNSNYEIEAKLDGNFIDSNLYAIGMGSTTIPLKIVGSDDTNIFTTTFTSIVVNIHGNIVVKDNWLNREVARQVYGNENRYTDLKISDYLLVDFISLNNKGLSGEIPSEISLLTNLKALYLSDNNLSGEIPGGIGKLTKLTGLILSGNKLSGSIPIEIGNLSSLEDLQLQDNKLSGSIPSSITNLSKLKYLNLRDNQLSGSIPSTINKLSNLLELRLYNNKLTGSIPASIGQLPRIENINLGNNNLSGSIPAEIGQAKTIQQLYLYSNQLSGEIPNELYDLTNLTVLYLNNNKLVGNISDRLANMTKLNTLRLVDNQILSVASNFPNKFKVDEVVGGNLIEGMPNQKQLVLKENEDISMVLGNRIETLVNLKDKVIVEWSNVREPLNIFYDIEYKVDSRFIDSELFAIALGSTNIILKIIGAEDTNPYATVKNPIVVTIINNEVIQDNWLNREVARQVFGNENRFTGLTDKEYKQITSINMNGKNINASIPTEIGRLVNMTSLSLVGCNINGELPNTIGNLTKLETLDLSNNKIAGELPKEIGHQISLKTLNLSTNKFTGSLPKELSWLVSLEYFYCSNAGFSEEIPYQLFLLEKLKTLDLRNNNLTGTISEEIVNLKSIVNMYFDGNILTGTIPSNIAKLTKLNAFTFTDNQIINLPSNFPAKFKVEASVKGNFIEAMPNQKQIVIKNPQKITIEINDVLTLPTFANSDVEIRWSGQVEQLSSEYSLEPRLMNELLFDSNLLAIIGGITEVKAKIVQANTTNTNAQSVNGVEVEVIKQHIPLRLTYTVSTTEWTNKDVIVSINAISSENILYIECSNGIRVSNNANADFAISKNGTYTFKAVNSIGEVETITITISNVDKVLPTLTLTKQATNNGNTYVITAVAGDTISGVKAIILPDGTYVYDDVAEYDAVLNGTYEFTVIDNAENRYTTSINVSGISVDGTWLLQEVGRQVGKNHTDLTQADYDSITTINLANKNITGLIPNEISKLTNLTTLRLNGNDLRGSIPSEIGNLSKLRILNLAENSITGSIPSTIGNMSSLTNLDLGLNKLTGSIPSSIGNLKNLQYLYLCENQLTGTVPTSLGNLTKLRDLCVDYNQLTGTIPIEVEDLSAYINFDYNFLEDTYSQNVLTVQDNTVLDISLDEEMDMSSMRRMIEMSTDFGTTVGISDDYSLEFVPDDESFFKDGKAIKTGVTTGRLRIVGSGDTNDSAITQNRITVVINAEIADDKEPNINLNILSTDWTNDSVSIIVKVEDDVELKEVIFDDGTKSTYSEFEYTASENRTYTITAVDMAGNKSTKTFTINNIDKEIPSLTVNYNDNGADSVDLTITSSDTMSGIRGIILPNGDVISGEEATYTITENGIHSVKVYDNAGNVNETVINIQNIPEKELPPEELPPEDDDNEENEPPVEEEPPIVEPPVVEPPVVEPPVVEPPVVEPPVVEPPTELPDDGSDDEESDDDSPETPGDNPSEEEPPVDEDIPDNEEGVPPTDDDVTEDDEVIPPVVMPDGPDSEIPDDTDKDEENEPPVVKPPTELPDESDKEEDDKTEDGGNIPEEPENNPSEGEKPPINEDAPDNGEEEKPGDKPDTEINPPIEEPSEKPEAPEETPLPDDVPEDDKEEDKKPNDEAPSTSTPDVDNENLDDSNILDDATDEDESSVVDNEEMEDDSIIDDVLMESDKEVLNTLATGIDSNNGNTSKNKSTLKSVLVTSSIVSTISAASYGIYISLVKRRKFK